MEAKKEYMGYGSELDEKTHEMVEKIYDKMDGGNEMGVNNNDVATLGLAGAVGYGGYGGYGRGGSDVGNGILFGQNKDIGRDTLKGNCDIQATVRQANVDNNNAGALREVAATLNANSNQSRTDDRFATLAATSASDRMHDTMMVMNNQSANREQFATTETKMDLLCQKLNSVEANAMGREIAAMQTASILAGQKTTMLEAQLKDFCCPKPSARYEVVGCGCHGGNGGSQAQVAPSITVVDVMNVVKTMMDAGNSKPGNS